MDSVDTLKEISNKRYVEDMNAFAGEQLAAEEDAQAADAALKEADR